MHSQRMLHGEPFIGSWAENVTLGTAARHVHDAHGGGAGLAHLVPPKVHDGGVGCEGGGGGGSPPPPRHRSPTGHGVLCRPVAVRGRGSARVCLNLELHACCDKHLPCSVTQPWTWT